MRGIAPAIERRTSMSSTAKTPNIGLNQWEASDAPLRVDFNQDNLLIDAAVGEGQKQMDSMSAGLEDVNHNVYQLYMQHYYNSKDVPSRATMFFDGFTNVSMRDESTTADRIQVGGGKYGLCNWDAGYYINLLSGKDNLVLVGKSGSLQVDSVAQSYHAPGPFRLLSVSIIKENQLSAVHQLELSVYAANSQGVPLSKQQTLQNFQMNNSENGQKSELFCVLNQPVILASADFSLCLSAPTMAASGSSTQYVAPYCTYNSNPAAMGNIYTYPSGSQWTECSGSYQNAKLAMILHGSVVNDPPKWVAREVVMSRPCSQAVVFLTQDAASVGRIYPKLALYETGETLEPIEMNRDPAKDILLPDGKVETCFTVIQPTAKSRAQLTIQFDGIHESDKVYEYGCVLGG